MESATSIAFLGGGNMARALIGGLLSAGHQPSAIRVHDIDPARTATLQKDFGVQIVDAAGELLAAEAIVLSVKPQQMNQALHFLRSSAVNAAGTVLISIAAGLRLQTLRGWSGGTLPVVRCMPNTPALVGYGASVLCAGDDVSVAQRALATAILHAVGTAHWVPDEAQMDAVTAISGSGPAYFFLFQEHLQQSAEALGLDATLARDLVVQTALGAAQLTAASSEPVSTLRQNVTSPGGTTERALQAFGAAGLAKIVQDAASAACARSRELSEELAS